jgi:iron complex outermembrane receptor protein
VPAGNETDPTPTNPTPAPLLNPLLDAINSTTYELGVKSLPTQIGTSAISLGYDVALYDTEVQNDIIPYAGGRYYASAARARRSGLEIGANLQSTSGIFGGAALTFSKNKYLEYVVDSGIVSTATAGRKADLSDHDIVGIPSIMTNFELGTEIPGARGLRIKGAVEHSGDYFADDVNKVSVPSFTIFNLTAALSRPIVAANGWGIRGFITVHNITDKKYIGSAFLNPDLVGAGAAAAPAAYEPGMPRTVIVSFSAGRLR